MSKNQINYLLVLATLAVAWLYFHTFYTTAIFQQRAAQWNVSRPSFAPSQNTPRVYPNTNRIFAASPAQVQKMIEAARKMPATPAAPAAADTAAKK